MDLLHVHFFLLKVEHNVIVIFKIQFLDKLFISYIMGLNVIKRRQTQDNADPSLIICGVVLGLFMAFG